MKGTDQDLFSKELVFRYFSQFRNSVKYHITLMLFSLFSNLVGHQFSWSELLLHLRAPPHPPRIDCVEADHHLSHWLLQYRLSGFSAFILSLSVPLLPPPFC